jgi:alkanesulfonate monooxygenase SsuD/methylene tetrahydromethanopterin reductase-like flavin-dependent oxidoreductase (luciferase family)
VRFGLALRAREGTPPLADLARQAAVAEAAGMALIWIAPSLEVEAPLIAAAAVAVATRSIRIAAVEAAGRHPLALAESAAVADNCSNGRLVLVLAGDDSEMLGETVDVVRLAFRGRPFSHRGQRWTIPATLAPNPGAEPRIVVTPPPAQLELPVWVTGTGAPAVASARGVALVADDGSAVTDGVRQALCAIDAEADGSFDVDALVDRLQRDGGTGGPDLAIVELPHTLDTAARERAIGDIASLVRPRVTMDRLPNGLAQHWAEHLPAQLAKAAS